MAKTKSKTAKKSTPKKKTSTQKNPQKKKTTRSSKKSTSKAPKKAGAKKGAASVRMLNAYKTALTARYLDEKGIILYKQNKCHFHIGCSGHELVGAAFSEAMTSGKDWFFPYYRDMAICTGLGMTSKEVCLNLLSKDGDPNSGGRQMPMHYGHSELRIVSQSSPTGTQFLQAVGAAMAIKHLGLDEVVYVSAGEGTTAQGDYHEALNWAAREKLPIIFVIQDNQFAISVHVSEHIAGSSVESISSGYEGLEVKRVDGETFKTIYKAAKQAVNRARSGEGGSVIIADVVRLGSHSISDNQEKYRSKKDIAADRKRDPLLALEKTLKKEKILSPKELSELQESIKKQIDEDALWAEDQADPDPNLVLDHVLVDEYPSPIPDEIGTGDELFMVDALNAALHEEMARDDKMIVYGQDVGYGKGGVFSVTQGLTKAFGEKRCFNSPLAESSIIGTAVGLAATGYHPVVEIQFGDYIWTAMMQIRNELSTLHYRSKGTLECPTVVRVAVGGYIRGGPYHSQNIEGTFSHFPGLVIVYPSNAADAKGLLKSAIRSNDPVLFLEHKGLYRQVHAKAVCGREDDLLPLGKARVAREGTDATIITWGAMVRKSLVASQRASEELGKEVEVIDIRTISPLDTQTIIESVKKTSKALIVHEDMEFMGFGAEIAAVLSEHAFEYLDAPVKRVGAQFSIVPLAPVLESAVLPQQDDVWEELNELLAY